MTQCKKQKTIWTHCEESKRYLLILSVALDVVGEILSVIDFSQKILNIQNKISTMKLEISTFKRKKENIESVNITGLKLLRHSDFLCVNDQFVILF